MRSVRSTLALAVCAASLALPGVAYSQATPLQVQSVSTDKATYAAGDTITFTAKVNNSYGGALLAAGHCSATGTVVCLSISTPFYNNGKSADFAAGVSTWTWTATAPSVQSLTSYTATVRVYDGFAGNFFQATGPFAVDKQPSGGGGSGGGGSATVGPTMISPLDGQTLDCAGAYLFKVNPVAGASGYLYGFFQNSAMVWENYRDEHTLSGTEYGIQIGSPGHAKFSAGPLEVWVRANVNNVWTDATRTTINLRAPCTVPPVQTADITAPDAPQRLGAAADCARSSREVNRVTLTWKANSEPDLDYYSVERVVDGKWVAVGRTQNLSYLDNGAPTGIVFDTIYYYQVRAVDKSGNQSAGAVANTVLRRAAGCTAGIPATNGGTGSVPGGPAGGSTGGPSPNGRTGGWVCLTGGRCDTKTSTTTAQLPTVQNLTRSVATSRAGSALASGFGRVYTRGNHKRLTCSRQSDSAYACAATWRYRTYRYRGKITVNRSGLVRIKVFRRRA